MEKSGKVATFVPTLIAQQGWGANLIGKRTFTNKMNDVQIIQQKIFEIRGQRVMLDFDLAALYGVETGALNQAVKRNIERFPEDFMFQLTKEEWDILKSHPTTLCSPNNQQDIILISQNVISSWGGRRKLPFAFTENGVAMLSSVLRSPLAIQINIGIMRVFTQIHRMAATLPPANTAADIAQLRQDFEDLKLDIEDILANQNDINEDTRAQLELINQSLAALQTSRKMPRRPIVGFSLPKKES